MAAPVAPASTRPVITEFADPLSALTLDALSTKRFATPERSISIRSDAMRVLVGELRRYCNLEVGGRSFLISGHRGAGKTTMIQHAFRQVFLEAARGTMRLRPVYVQLHGPSLFPDFVAGTGGGAPSTVGARSDLTSASDGVGAAARPVAGTAPPSSDATPGVLREKPVTSATSLARAAVPAGTEGDQSVSARDARLALEQITLALHRAISREYVDAVWRKAAPPVPMIPASDDKFPAAATLGPVGRAELAASFEHELYECPSAMRLRDFWTRLGAMSSGVLRPGVFPAGSVAASSQGMRELVALVGVCEAYRRIAGHVEQSDSDTQDAAQRIEAALSVDTTGRAAVPAIASMITGGLVGGGIAVGTRDPIAATLGGLVAALGSSLVYKWSMTRSRSRAVKREYRFLFDTSLGTLDRVLPVLLQRLLAAGLAPIFVVDELDKVDHLSDRIFGMVRHLKKLVAESAFFCFLTDRSYFEDMRGRAEGSAYPLEYSYFTHRLFVSYGPDHLHEYLGELLDEPGRKSADAGPPQSTAAATNPPPPEYPLLRYMLLHRSEMHALELHRLLKSIRGENGVVTLDPADLRNRATYRMDIGLQLGLEIILEEDDVRDRMRDEPVFQRLVHDALLYPSRAWQEGAMELEFSPARQAEFYDYLVGRMNRSEATRAVQRREATRQARGRRRSRVAEVVEQNDVKILWEKVRQYVEILSDKKTLEKRFNEWNAARTKSGRPLVDRAVLDVLATDESLFIRDAHNTASFRWRYDRYGVDASAQAARARAAAQPQPSDPTDIAMDLIEAFSTGLAGLSL